MTSDIFGLRPAAGVVWRHIFGLHPAAGVVWRHFYGLHPAAGVVWRHFYGLYSASWLVRRHFYGLRPAAGVVWRHFYGLHPASWVAWRHFYGLRPRLEWCGGTFMAFARGWSGLEALLWPSPHSLVGAEAHFWPSPLARAEHPRHQERHQPRSFRHQERPDCSSRFGLTSMADPSGPHERRGSVPSRNTSTAPSPGQAGEASRPVAGSI